MMKVLSRRIMSFLLATIILVTTSGFTVFEHHCRTMKTIEYSLVIPDFDCDHNGHDHADDLPACCALSSVQQASEECGESDCCQIDSFVVKLNITLDNQGLAKKMSLGMLSILPGEESEMFFTDKEEQGIIINNDLPPPLSGKELLIYLHQLNIPNPSV